MLIWAAPGPSASRQLVETAARELKLAVRFCTYKELLDLLHTSAATWRASSSLRRAPRPHAAEGVVERMPRLTTVVPQRYQRSP